MTLRQEHFTTRSNFVGLRRTSSGKKGARLPPPEQYFAPRVTLETRASQKMQVRDPELDLIPIEILKRLHDAAFKSNPTLLARLPVVEIKRLDGKVHRGVFVHAENFNPPPGCCRIVSLDEYSADRVTWLGDSESTTYGTELGDQWTKMQRGNRSLASAKSIKDKKDGLVLSPDIWCDEKGQIFKSMQSITDAVASIESHRQTKLAEKKCSRTHHEP